jgi:membrane fusion protein (multidrug efflux system)
MSDSNTNSTAQARSEATAQESAPRLEGERGGQALVQTPALKARRLRLLSVATGVLALLGAAYGVYWAKDLRHVQSTDDAYVSGNVVQITPQVSGTVVRIGADNTQFVKAGQTLVQLDREDAKVALDQAEAQLAKTVREVRNLFATSAQLQAAVEVRQADLATAQQDFQRRERLGSSGAVSAEELQHARDALKASQAGLVSAQQQLIANRARVDGTTVSDHPDVRNAAAAVRSAYLAYTRTQLPAPVSGFVAQRSVQLGQRVSPGAALMAVVPLDQVWVDANFKEPQLADIRVGQPVELSADVYGGHVQYHGTVVGFGAGTGSAFSLLPAQNATGNWIKVVQRVPVRIALDARELEEHPLQIGLSMKVHVDTHDRTGSTLPRLAATSASYATDVFNAEDDQADTRVRDIIASNEQRRIASDAARPAEDAGSMQLAATQVRSGKLVAARRLPMTAPATNHQF